jgi:hypothetical protein
MTLMPVDTVGPKRHVSLPILPPLQGGIVEARAALERFVGHLGPSLGNVFLIPHPWIGMVLWLAVAWNPRLAAFALLGLGVAWAGQLALGIKGKAGIGGGLKANALLSAIAAGWMTAPTIYPLHVQVGIALAASASAFVITAALMRALKDTEWPSLLWGYCLTAGTLFAMFPVGAMLAAQRLTWWRTPPADAADWIGMFFRSIGSLMFAPSIEVGLIVVCAILLWSRAAFAAGVMGWIVGAAVAVGVQDLGVTYYWLPAAHNYFVAGMAIGALFILPGHASLLLAGLAGAGASIFDAALQTLFPTFAYLPMASALTIWTGLGTLALAGGRRGFWRNRSPHSPPEEAWWRDVTWAQRFGRSEPLLALPVAGVVRIAQGFGGSLSHCEQFRHALDFMHPPAPPPTARGEVAAATSIWKAAVTAPAAGFVERVRDGVPDNPLGGCNFSESWGNYVCIRLDQGGWALLAHFKQWSIAVQPGARVEIGTYLGTVGNSGRSPVPHLHLQVQDGPDPGASTIPFRIANYQSGPRADEALHEWNAAKVPEQDALVTAAIANPTVHSMLASLSPGSSLWTVDEYGRLPRSFRERRADLGLQVQIRLDAWGRHCFECNGGSLVAALAPDGWRVVEQRGASPLLRLLAHAAPSVPYAAQAGMSWTDMVSAMPAGRVPAVALLMAPYRTRPFTYTRSTCTTVSPLQDEGLTVETVLAPRDLSLPSQVVCRFDWVRGPVSIEATFAHGSVRYSLVAFTPGLPS